jgi:outer membrane protein assembly factor BamB
LGPQRDGVWRETGIVEKLPEGGPPIRWRTPIGGGYTGPAVADGRVYVVDRMLAQGAKNPTNEFLRGTIPGTERVLCLNEVDGKILWTHEYDCPYTVSYAYGPRTTPVVQDKRIYTLGTEGHLFCLQADSGKVIWSHDLKLDYGAKTPIWGFSSHLLLDGQKLFSMVGGKGSAVVAFDKDTGKEIWRALDSEQIGYCPPMIYEAGGKRQLIIWHSDAINGLDLETGKAYWTVPNKTYQAMAISTPRKEGNLLFITSTNMNAMLLRLATDRPAAEIVWKGDRNNKLGLFSVFSTPFFEDGYIYGSSTEGQLTCVKADTGERLWESFEPNKGKKIRTADVFLVKNGDRFFLFNEQGDLIIAKLSPKGYEEISRAHLLEATSKAFGRDVLWSHPAFANKRMYARNDKEIICVSLAK